MVGRGGAEDGLTAPNVMIDCLFFLCSNARPAVGFWTSGSPASMISSMAARSNPSARLILFFSFSLAVCHVHPEGGAYMLSRPYASKISPTSYSNLPSDEMVEVEAEVER